MSDGVTLPGVGERTSAAGPRNGRLVLVPNTLDFGVGNGNGNGDGNGDGDAQADIRDLLPLGVIERAVVLEHWLVENARSARAFIRRCAVAAGREVVLQALDIREMPRARKGSPGGGAPSPAQRDEALAALKAGHDLGLLSEAGLPGVADPGRDWVAEAHALGHAVQVLPGASSITLAVAASGLQGQSFAFVGYLPVEATERRARIQALEQASRRLQQTQVLIETPYRNPALAEALVATLAPNTQLSVSVALAAPGGYTVTRRVQDWRRSTFTWPDRLPAVFCLMAASPAAAG